MSYKNLLERFITWTQASRLGFECKIFFGVDDLKVHLVVMGQPRQVRCRHEFEWERQGEWICKFCHMLVGVIYREKHGQVILDHLNSETQIKAKRA